LGIRVVRESDRNFKMPDAKKKWTPEQCPSYRPPRKPSVRTSRRISEGDLIGWWVTINIGGHEYEVWGFHPGGSGTLGIPAGLSGFEEFKFIWRVRRPNRVNLSGPDERGGFLFFLEGPSLMTISERINPYGEKSTVLKVRSGKRKFELSKRTDNFWEEHKRKFASVDWPGVEKILKKRIVKAIRDC